MNLNSIGGSSSLQQMQQALFAKVDANSDGQLSSDEFLSIGQNLQGGGNSGAAREMRGRSGAGGDFASATMGSMLSLQELQSRHEARAAEMFTGADSDGDGALTAEELAADLAAKAPAGAGGDTAEMAAGMIAQADADGDGTLSVEEFGAARPPAPPPGGMMAGGAGEETSSDPLDTNGDGKVSMSELLASLQTVDESESGFSTEVSDLFSQLVAKLTEETDSTVLQTA